MWPLLLDMTEEESIHCLRHLELEAYSALVSALRAQGSLNQDKRRILKETSTVLNISNERHKAEVRRAISDEKLNTIAYNIAGRLNSFEDWAQEGRRLVPLLPRMSPQTPYTVVANEASDAATQYNKQLPFPANTERKRSILQSVVPVSGANETNGKSMAFRLPEVPKDEPKKRKCHNSIDGSSLAQHLLSSKLTKIQQIYRQASMAPRQKPKDVLEVENIEVTKPIENLPQVQQHMNANTSKINIIQNISIPYTKEEIPNVEDKSMKESNVTSKSANENQISASKSFNTKPNNILASKQSPSSHVSDLEQVIDPAKLCLTKKTINKGQKLIVVSNAQTLPTNSILQKTLSVPINKLTKLNLDKFKIVPNSQLPSTLQVTNVIPHQKPKLVTIKGSSGGKKVIPLSQLQMLNPKGNIKVVPYAGRMDTSISQNKTSTLPINNSNLEDAIHTTSMYNNDLQVERVKTVVENVEEFQIIELNSNKLDNEIVHFEEQETDGRNSNGDCNAVAMVMNDCEVEEVQQNAEIFETLEDIETELLH